MLKVRRAHWFVLYGGLLVGCQRSTPSPVHISGTVTYKGNPVPAGTIIFHSADSGSYSSPLNANGSYEVHQLPEAKLTVTIETASVNPAKKAPGYGDGKGAKQYAQRVAAEGNAAAGKQPPQEYVKVPARYADVRKSPLFIVPKAGPQVLDLVLTDD